MYAKKKFTYRKRKPFRKTFNNRVMASVNKNIEYKSIDTVVTTDVNTTPTFELLNGIALGNELNQRDGRQITIKSIEISCSVRPTYSTGIMQTARYVLFYDKQSNAAVPTVTDVLTSSSVTSSRNLNNRHRFIILLDKQIGLDTQREVFWKYYKRHNLKTCYNQQGTALISDIVTGSLYLMKLGNVGPGSQAANSAINVRVRYIDM